MLRFTEGTSGRAVSTLDVEGWSNFSESLLLKKESNMHGVFLTSFISSQDFLVCRHGTYHLPRYHFLFFWIPFISSFAHNVNL